MLKILNYLDILINIIRLGYLIAEQGAKGKEDQLQIRYLVGLIA